MRTAICIHQHHQMEDMIILLFSSLHRLVWLFPCARGGSKKKNNKAGVQQRKYCCSIFGGVLTELPCPKVVDFWKTLLVLCPRYGKPDQIIQPWQFGHGETKATCLWLKGLPKLVPTILYPVGREQGYYGLPQTTGVFCRSIDLSRYCKSRWLLNGLIS